MTIEFELFDENKLVFPIEDVYRLLSNPSNDLASRKEYHLVGASLYSHRGSDTVVRGNDRELYFVGVLHPLLGRLDGKDADQTRYYLKEYEDYYSSFYGHRFEIENGVCTTRKRYMAEACQQVVLPLAKTIVAESLKKKGQSCRFNVLTHTCANKKGYYQKDTFIPLSLTWNVDENGLVRNVRKTLATDVCGTIKKRSDYTLPEGYMYTEKIPFYVEPQKNKS